MKKILFILPILVIACSQGKMPKYKDPNSSIESRINDLLSRMTVEEKIAQLHSCRIKDSIGWDSDGNYTGSDDTLKLKLGSGAICRSGGGDGIAEQGQRR